MTALPLAAGARPVGAVGQRYARAAGIGEAPVAAGVVGIGDGDAVLEGAHRHDLLRDEGGVRRVRLRGRHEHELGAGQREMPHGFRELHVVADEDAHLQSAELDDARRRGRRA